MFTLEVRINGSMIGHVYGHNKGISKNNKYMDSYSWEYYRPEIRKIQHGKLDHARDEGIDSLLIKILEAAKGE